MSWSFYATGKPKAVLAKADEEFKRIDGQITAVPERSIAQLVHTMIATALGGMPDSSAVSIQSSGSQSTTVDGAYNSINLVIQPIYGFVE